MSEEYYATLADGLIVTKESVWNEAWNDWVLHIRVKKKDRTDGITWDQMQRAKNLAIGSNGWAIEVFPAHDHLVNSANCRHLWVIPERLREKIGIPDYSIMYRRGRIGRDVRMSSPMIRLIKGGSQCLKRFWCLGLLPLYCV
jgi:hypothetical protein